MALLSPSNGLSLRKRPKAARKGDEVEGIYGGATVEMKDAIRIQVREGATGRLVSEYRGGDELRKSVGDWIDKQRVVDHAAGIYQEFVIDRATCEVLHFCFESLVAHRGHGNAKQRPAANREP